MMVVDAWGDTEAAVKCACFTCGVSERCLLSIAQALSRCGSAAGVERPPSGGRAGGSSGMQEDGCGGGPS